MINYQLWLGDCLEEMDRIEDGSVDAIICDLPYGQTNCFWDSVIPLEPLWKQCKRVIKPKGAIVLFGSQPFTTDLINSNRKWFKYEWVWEKHKGTNIYAIKTMPLKIHENCLVFYESELKTYNPQMTEGKPYTPRGSHNLGKKDALLIANKPVGYASGFDSSKRYPVSIQRFTNHNQLENSLHPTQKPVALLEYLIKTYTNEGEKVLDNTFGSCTTGEACLRTGRRFVGIEKDANYFEIGKARMERVAAELRGELNHLPMFAEVGL